MLNLVCELHFHLFSLEMDVFSRFEEEAGGMLMTATLCLLEVSRHGLLETELLALLGNPENLKPSEFIEAEESCVVVEPEVNEASKEDEKPDTENIKELTEKMKTLVTETYVMNEKNEKDKTDISEQKKAKARRRIQLLPAREWAIIYRNLKQLLRPCGDLGEGRLDFYHRSLSKAVRRK